MSEVLPERPRYRERQLLTAADLETEQAYRLALRRRHAVTLHGWGIVSGLELGHRAGVGLEVAPGAAVDGFGRAIVVGEPFLLDAGTLEELRSQIGGSVAVWLLYGRKPVTPRRPGRQACGPGSHGRWREEGKLRLTAAEGIDPRRLLGVEEPAPHRQPPDDPAVEWPVFLGRLEPNAAGEITVDLEDRPYATLTAGLVRDPRDRVRLGLPREPDNRRFVVSLSDREGVHRERLTVDREGATTVRGDAVVAGGLSLVTTDSQPSQGVGLGRLAETPAEAAPWSVYRTRPEGGDEQLRVEIGHPGGQGDPANFRLVIGCRDGGEFTPSLSVDGEGRLTVHGDLKPEGQIIEAPRAADPDDPRFASEAARVWLHGIDAAVQQVGLSLGQDAGLEMELDVDPDGDGLVEQVPFSVTVRNPGSVTLSSLHVVATLSLVDAGREFETTVVESASVEPGQSNTKVSRIDTGTPVGAGTLTVVASAITPGRSVVAAQAKVNVFVMAIPG